MDHAEKLKGIDEEFIKKGAGKTTEEDVQKVVDKKNEIQEKFSGGVLKQYIQQARDLISMVEDYVKGNYREVPWFTIAAVVFSLLYALSPIDLIPDVIPVVGLLDDAFVISVCMTLVGGDVERYLDWKRAA